MIDFIQNLDLPIAAAFSIKITSWVYKVLVVVLIYIVGKILIKAISSKIEKVCDKNNYDKLLSQFLSGIIKWLLYISLILIILQFVGISSAPLLTIFGAAGLAVGLALKDSLQNFASGVMLIIFRQFKVGDLINAGGATGVVDKIKIFTTILNTPDNTQISVPNSVIFSGSITNFSAHDTRRIDLVVGVGYDDDLKKAKEAIENVLSSNEKILKDPSPLVAVSELGASSVDFVVRAWVNASDFFPVKCEITEAIKLSLDEANISIPYPQMDLHVVKGNITE